MGWRALAWALGQRLKTREKMVLVTLANRINDETGVAWPSTATLAKEAGMARSTLVGAVKIQRRRTDSRENLSNIYAVNLRWGVQEDRGGVVRQPDNPVREPDEGSPADGHEPVSEPAIEPNDNNVRRVRVRVAFNGEVFTGIDESLRSRWQQACPDIDVDNQLKRAACWLDSEPGDQDRGDLTRFLTSWMCRAQDRAPPRLATHGARHRERWTAHPTHRSRSDERADWLARVTGQHRRPDDPDTIDMPIQ